MRLPSNKQIERSLLGLFLVDSESFAINGPRLVKEDFFFPTHREIFDALRAMNRSGQAINPVTLHAELQERGTQLDIARLGDLMDSSFSRFGDADIQTAIDRLIEMALERRAIALAHQVQTKLLDGESLDDALAEFSRETGLLQNRAARERSTMTERMDALISRLELTQESGRAPGLRTGFPDLDKVIHGLRKGFVYVIAGGSNEGKTTLTLQIALRACQHKDNDNPVILFISLEMSQEAVDERLVQIISLVPEQRMHQGTMTKEDWRAVMNAREQIAACRIEVYDEFTGTVEEVKTAIAETRRKFGKVDLVVIDYAQLMSVANVGNQNRTQQLDDIVRGLKRLAVKEKVPIIELSQITGEAEKSSKRDAVDVRDSKAIKQAADVLIMLSCQDIEALKSGIVTAFNLDIAKNRFGRRPVLQLAFDPRYGVFGDAGNRD